MNIIKGQKVKYEDVDYNLVSHQIGVDIVTMQLKKRVNCRICKEIEVEADIINGVIDWDTLRKS